MPAVAFQRQRPTSFLCALALSLLFAVTVCLWRIPTFPAAAVQSSQYKDHSGSSGSQLALQSTVSRRLATPLHLRLFITTTSKDAQGLEESYSSALRSLKQLPWAARKSINRLSALAGQRGVDRECQKQDDYVSGLTIIVNLGQTHVA